jgi:hypothetical protein
MKNLIHPNVLVSGGSRLTGTVIYDSFGLVMQEGKGGRRASSDEEIGTSQRVFALDPALPDVIKQQLAWTTYSLLKNTRTTLVVSYW